MEKFDLEKALSGYPVKLRNGRKAIIVFNSKTLPYKTESAYPLLGYIINKDGDGIVIHETWTIEGFYTCNNNYSDYDIVGMWPAGAEHISIELPRPLLQPELNSRIYIITNNFTIYGQVYKELNHQKDAIKQGRVFKTEEDAQMWLDALVNSRG